MIVPSRSSKIEDRRKKQGQRRKKNEERSRKKEEGRIKSRRVRSRRVRRRIIRRRRRRRRKRERKKENSAGKAKELMDKSFQRFQAVTPREWSNTSIWSPGSQWPALAHAYGTGTRLWKNGVFTTGKRLKSCYYEKVSRGKCVA